MNFHDLMDLPHDKRSGIIDFNAIRKALPDTPSDVAKQLYADHGRNEEFQRAYEKLNISQIKWSLLEKQAELLVAVSMNENFRRWFVTVGGRTARFRQDNWKCIDVRKKVQDHWAEHKTWLVPPILFSAELVGSDSPLHLVEGHTRVGLLAGLVQQNVLSAQSMHLVWLGTTNTA